MPKKIDIKNSNRRQTKNNDNVKVKLQLDNKPGIMLDLINVQILNKILKDPRIRSSEISEHIKVPLSTIQRRRSLLEDSDFLQRRFEINYGKFSFRTADLLIKVAKGKMDIVTNEIIKKHSKSIIETSIRLGQLDVNLVVRVIYKSSDEIYEIIRTINEIDFVESVQWSEIVKRIQTQEEGLVDNLFSINRSKK